MEREGELHRVHRIETYVWTSVILNMERLDTLQGPSDKMQLNQVKT